MSRTFRATMLAGVSLCALLSRRTGGRATIRERTCLPPGSAGACPRGDHGLAPPGELYSRGLRRHSRSGWRKRLGLERRGPAGRQRLACRLDACAACGRVIAKTRCWSISRPSVSRASAAITARSRQRPTPTPAAERKAGAGAALAGGRPGHGCRGPPFGDTPRLPVRYSSSAGRCPRAAPRSPGRCAIPTPTPTNV